MAVIMVKVKKADYCPNLTDENGIRYPDGVFSTQKTIYVTRRMRDGDLIEIKD
jgi:hypothetical protein